MHYWERLHYEVPYAAMDVAAHRERYRCLRENVMLVVRDYNGILGALSPTQVKLGQNRSNPTLTLALTLTLTLTLTLALTLTLTRRVRLSCAACRTRSSTTAVRRRPLHIPYNYGHDSLRP